MRCDWCGENVRALEPNASHTSLGLMHGTCAPEAWEANRKAESGRRESSRAKRSEAMKKRWAARADA